MPTGWTNFCCGTLPTKAGQKTCYVWPYGVPAANATLLKSYTSYKNSLSAATRVCVAAYDGGASAWATWNHSQYANYTSMVVSNAPIGTRRLLQADDGLGLCLLGSFNAHRDGSGACTSCPAFASTAFPWYSTCAIKYAL